MIDQARAVVYEDGTIEVCIIAEFYEDGLGMPVSVRSASEGVFVTRAKAGEEARLRMTYDRVFEDLSKQHSGIATDTGWRDVAQRKPIGGGPS